MILPDPKGYLQSLLTEDKRLLLHSCLSNNILFAFSFVTDLTLTFYIVSNLMQIDTKA